MGTRYSVSQLSGSSGTYGLSIRKSDVLLTGSLLLSGSSSRIQLGTDYSQGRQKNGVFIPNEIFIGQGHSGTTPVPNAVMNFKSQKLVLSGAAGSSGASSFAIDTLGSGVDHIINTTGDWRIKSTNWGSNTGHYFKIDASTAGKYVLQAKNDGGADSGVTQTFYAGTPGSSGRPSQIKFASGSMQAFFLIDASGSTTDGGSSDRGIYVRNANIGLRYGAGSSQGQDAAGTFFNISGSMVGPSGQKVAETVVSVTPPLNDSSGTKAARLIFAAVSGSIVGAGRGDGRGTEYENRLFVVDGGGLDGAGPKLHVSGTIPLEFGNTDAYVKSDGASGVTISSAAALSAKGATGASFGDDTGTWEFNGSGVVTETGMASLSVTPSGAITLTAGAASTWSTSAGALTLTSAAAATWKTSAGALTLDGTGGVNIQEGGGDIITISDSKAVAVTNATTVDIDGSGAVSINSSAAAINIGNDAVAQAINIGDGAAARTITIGNDASTKVDVNALAIELDAAASVVIDAVTTVDIDSAGVMSLNSSAAAINIGNDDVDAAINIGTQGERTVSISTGAFASTVNIGNETGATAVDIDAGTGGVTIDSQGAGTIAIGTETDTGAINIGVGASARTITVGNDASTKVDVNALAIELDSAGTIVGTSVTTTALTATTTMTVKGNTGASFGDDTGTWEFDGSGAVTETGMTSLSVTPSGAITLTAGAASTWSTSAGALTLTSAAAATWKTSAGALTLDGTGGVNIQEGGGDIITISDSKAVAVTNATTIDLDGSGIISINSSAAAINVGNDDVDAAINVGTAGERTITVGSSDATTVVDGGTLTLGSNASTVTLGGSSTTTTIAGDLIVQGTGSFEHSTDISITDRIFLMASGSTTKNTSGGIAIASGSNSTAQAMVFGAYGSTFVDTFIAGRLDIQEDVSHVNSLSSATPISIYAQAMRLKHASGGGSLILSSSATGDSGHRVLSVDTADGNRTFTLNENLTVGDGANVTITAEDAAGTITLDNINLEVEDTAGSGGTLKLISTSGGNATLNVEGTSGVINQDVSSDAQPTFAGLKSTSDLIVSSSNGLILGDSDNSAAVKIVAPGTVSTGYTLTLPAVGTANNGYVLKAASGASTSAVTLEWATDTSGGVTVGSGVTSGTATRIFYEDSSNQIAQSGNFTFDETSVLRIGSTTEGELQLGNDTNNAIGSMKSKLLTAQNLDGATIVIDSFAAADFTGGTYLVTISQTSGGTGASSPYKTLVAQLTIACNSDASTSVIAETRASTDDDVFDEISFSLADGGSTLSVRVTGTASANTLDSCSISFTRTLIGL